MLHYIVITILFFYNLFDVNYFIRTYYTVLSGRIYQKTVSLNDTTTIYGMCSFQNCDITFRYLRLARILRDIDFARYHFYDRTGIYRRSKNLKIKSLQGCTLTLCAKPVNIFTFYKINTKLVYWDEKSLFFEHELVTMSDGITRHMIVSRQYAIGAKEVSTKDLLKNISGSEKKPICPEYIKLWLRSMQLSSLKLRGLNK